jgi:hypothetical protein
MGPGTVYEIDAESNPFVNTARSDQLSPRAWAHGSSMGAQWMNERTVPIRLFINGPERNSASWLAARNDLARAFASVAASGEIVELGFEFGGEEFVLFGTPWMVEPEMGLSSLGRGFARCTFIAHDPRIYSAELTVSSTGLPLQTVGLTVPFTVPFAIPSRVVGGQMTLTNTGTAESGLLMRVDGPAIRPHIILRHPDHPDQSIRFLFDLDEGQWLDIDSTTRSAFLNGLPQSSRRGQLAWLMDTYPLAPGVTTVRFGAGQYNPDALLTVSARSAFW